MYSGFQLRNASRSRSEVRPKRLPTGRELGLRRLLHVLLVYHLGRLRWGWRVRFHLWTPSVAKFIMSHEKIQIPKSGKIYSFNEGNYDMWAPGLKQYMDSLKTGGKETGSKPYSARYIGSLVGDFHRTMLYGGIYGYPGMPRTRTVSYACCTSARR